MWKYPLPLSFAIGERKRRRYFLPRPAGFLARGVQAYIGHFWPVGDINAAIFARRFYEVLFGARNIGEAVCEARRAVSGAFEERSDLTAVGAVFFGDSGTAERADLAMAN